MWQTLRDRLRIPWRGGAKQLSVEAVLPALVLPLIFGVAALNQYLAGLITFTVAILLMFGHYRVQRQQLRTRFFCMWLIWSLIYMVILFESTVPLLEVLPEENLMLVILSFLSVLLLYRTRQRATFNQVLQIPATTTTTLSTANTNKTDDLLSDIFEEEDETPLTTTATDVIDAEAQPQKMSQQFINCPTCRKNVPPRTAHCSLCSACILRHDHHSYWLDCCIGKFNHLTYFMGMLLGASALLLGANFILTAVCHPLLVKRIFGVPLMLPDDCSQVFTEYDLCNRHGIIYESSTSTTNLFSFHWTHVN